MPLNFPNLFNDKKYNNPPELHGSLPIQRAKVVSNNDKKKIGRIKIRIPSYHGMPGKTQRYIEDDDLPWAMPCFFGGCGQDFGSFIVPIPGTYVWVLFEDNDVEKPVYLGGVPAAGSPLSKLVNNLGDPLSPQLPWMTTPMMTDDPWDVYDGKSSGVPERGVIYKSQKGHTIMFDDTDNEESMTFMDRVGQIIKFFSPVTKGQNATRYHRHLRTSEKNEQLGEGLGGDPSIMLRSGELGDGDGKKFLHSMIRMYQTRMRGECIDSENSKFTTTDYDPYEYNQQTQHSILNMTEDHIFISFPDILQYFCEDYWSLVAFSKYCNIECTEDHMLFQFKGNGLYIDSDKLKLTFKGTTLVETDKDFTVNTQDFFTMSSKGANIRGDKNLSGSGKEIKFEGTGSIYTQGGKTYMLGTEIHFNKS